jgi:hypothetical protein
MSRSFKREADGGSGNESEGERARGGITNSIFILLQSLVDEFFFEFVDLI